MQRDKRYAPELAYFNAVACLLVILIHVLSQGISQAEPTSWQLAVIYFPWRLAAFVVPAFLFSGGVKLALSLGPRWNAGQYGRYVLSRIRKIYLPYLLWNGIYYLVFLRIGYVRGSLGELLRYIWVGNLSSPFYYVVIVMQFYLLQPVWFWLVRRVPWHVGVLCAGLVSLVSLYANTILGLFGLSFGYWDRVFPTYLLFWVMGLYAGRYYEAFVHSVVENRAGAVLAALAVVGMSALAYFQYSRKVWLFDLGPGKLVTDCLSIVLLLWLSGRLARSGARLRGALEYIHAASFFVYLSHCLFLTLCAYVLQRLGVSQLSVLLVCRFAVCYTLPFLCYALWRRARSGLKRYL